jgi:probable rRNA maturation factor
MKLELTLDNASSSASVPDEEDVHRWVISTLSPNRPAAAIAVRIVDEQESAELNEQFRQKAGATNVLSFPADIPADIQSQFEYPILGDLIICAPVVENEAVEQHKTIQAHWAHMVVHGCLHLLGYDHIADHDAEQMEQLEIDILSRCGFADPYHTDSH